MLALTKLYDKCFWFIICAYFLFITGVGVTLIFHAPPGSGIDENWHFKRALQISQGDLLAKQYGPNDWGGPLDGRILIYVYKVKFQIDRRPFQSFLKSDVEHLSRDLDREANNRINAHFPSTASFPPLPYIAQGLGLWGARNLGLSTSAQFLAGRFANLFSFLGGLAAVIALMPRCKLLTLCVLSPPTALHLAASYSADPTTTVLTGLFFAFWLRLYLEPQPTLLSINHRIILLTLGLCLALTKIPFTLLLLLIFFLPKVYWSNTRTEYLQKTVFVALPLAVAAAWNLSYPFNPGPYWHSGGDAHAMAQLFFKHPYRQFGILIKDAWMTRDEWWGDGFNRYCSGPLPIFFSDSARRAHFGFCVIMGLVAISGERTNHRLSGLIIISVGLAFALLNLLLFKIAFTPLGAYHTLGIQGRYFYGAWLLCAIGLSLVLPRTSQFRAFGAVFILAYAVIIAQASNFALQAYATMWH